MLTPLDAAHIDELLADRRRIRALAQAVEASYHVSLLDPRVDVPADVRALVDRAWLAAGVARAEWLAARERVRVLGQVAA